MSELVRKVSFALTWRLLQRDQNCLCSMGPQHPKWTSAHKSNTCASLKNDSMTQCMLQYPIPAMLFGVLINLCVSFYKRSWYSDDIVLNICATLSTVIWHLRLGGWWKSAVLY